MARITYTKENVPEEFVNPYHFVPLGEKCDRKYDYRALKRESGLLTGWIECELETKSPVFIPNSSNDDVFQKRVGNDKVKSYDFFSREDLSERFNPPPPSRPVIPGSELRGVFRSAFEAVTNSCMSTTDDESVLFKRTTTPGSPGIVRRSNDGTWHLQPCQERIGVAAWKNYCKTPNGRDPNDFSHKIDDVSEGSEIAFEKSTGKYRNSKNKEVFFVATSFGEGKERGSLHKGESFHNKHHESIFVPDPDRDKILLSDRELENLIHNYRLYADEKVNQSLAAGSHNGYRSFLEKTGKSNADDLEPNDLNNALVYYKKVGSFLYLCPAAIGREVFHKRLKNLLGSFAPCETSDKLCPACALFGFVAGKDSVAGRVRFSDAEFSPSERAPSPLFLKPMVLPELASPKPSATEFYLERPSKKPEQGGQEREADLWNYDYAGNWKGMTLESLQQYEAKIRGRKFYWHGEMARNVESPATKKRGDEAISKRHVKVRPLQDGVSFRFKVYFDEITESELKKLLWVLSIGNSVEHGHKIGMGKPVRLGSILVKIRDVIVRFVRLSEERGMEYEYETLSSCCHLRDLVDSVNLVGVNEEKNAEQAVRLLEGDLESVKAFLKIAKFENGFRNLIDYPRLDSRSSDCKNKHAVYHWFVGNKQVTPTEERPIIDQELPPSGVRPIIDQELPPIDSPRLKKIKAEKE